MITIDGSSGGGQLLRSSLSLSALTKKPFRMTNIRAKRKNPGLQRQHLTAVNAISKICNAKVSGNEIHSKEIEFIPSKVVSGNYKLDIGTAGSTTLVLQTLLPPLIFAEDKSEIEITGGTANPLAPPVFDIKEVFLWHLEKIGIKADVEIIKEGFYPKGGGKIMAIIYPAKEIKELKLQDTKEGHYEETKITAVSSDELRIKNVCGRMIKGFKLNFPVGIRINSEENYAKTMNPGCYIHANYSYNGCKIGMSVLGEMTKKSEDLGRECAVKLLEEIKAGATTDHFTADQLLIYMAIKGAGKMRVSQITEHMKTNVDVIKKFLDVKFIISNNIIQCQK